jgi:hypothetical protein
MADDKNDEERQTKTMLMGLAGLALLAMLIIGAAVLAGHGLSGD